MVDEVPPQRYNAALANEIECKWQDRWDEQHVFYTPNRTGLLSEDPRHLADRPHLFLYHYKLFWGMSDKVAGFQPHPDGLIRLQGVSLAR